MIYLQKIIYRLSLLNFRRKHKKNLILKNNLVVYYIFFLKIFLIYFCKKMYSVRSISIKVRLEIINFDGKYTYVLMWAFLTKTFDHRSF
jgi:hypothetical protein